MDSTVWPENFCDIGGKTFLWVFENRKSFVEFTSDEMREPSGFFKKWHDYCMVKLKND